MTEDFRIPEQLPAASGRLFHFSARNRADIHVSNSHLDGKKCTLEMSSIHFSPHSIARYSSRRCADGTLQIDSQTPQRSRNTSTSRVLALSKRWQSDGATRRSGRMASCSGDKRLPHRIIRWHPPAPGRPGHYLGARVEPLHAGRSILGHAIPTAKQQYEVAQGPAAVPRRDELHGVEVAPAARQRGDEVRDEPPHVRATHGDRVFRPGMAPEPHGHQPAVEKVASVAHRAFTAGRR